jgi:hypothetical protein
MPNERYPGAMVRDLYHALILTNRSPTQVAVWISFDNEWWMAPSLPSRANSLVIPVTEGTYVRWRAISIGQLLGITSSTTPTTVSRVRRSPSMKRSFAGKGSSAALALCWAQLWYSRFSRYHRSSLSVPRAGFRDSPWAAVNLNFLPIKLSGLGILSFKTCAPLAFAAASEASDTLLAPLLD